MRVLYFDCFSGASGDMILGALIDAGVPLDGVRRALGSLAIGPDAVWTERVIRTGISATKFCVRGQDVQDAQTHAPASRQHSHAHAHAHDHEHAHDLGQAHEQSHGRTREHSQHEHRTLAEIAHLIDGSALTPAGKARAKALFTRLGEVEAGIHGLPLDQVHLHEVGALDSIVDIVGAVHALDTLGIDRIVSSPLNVGSGTIHSAHGVYPVPAPATLQLLAGAPIYAGSQKAEMVTPTGALIVTEYANGFGSLPRMRVEKVGYGAGTRDFPDTPNVLRVVIGEAVEDAAADGRPAPVAGDAPARVCVIEAEIDDMSPQIFGVLMDQLLGQGALDVFYTPVQMKKNRPGTLLTVIAAPDARERLSSTIFRETTTIGIRYRESDREVLDRETVTVATPAGDIRIKVARRAGRVLNAAPEFDDCVRAAAASGRPVKDVQALATRAFYDRPQGILTVRYYLTTAIDYVNSRPHLGTAYEKVTADVIARYKRLCGFDVHFLMGNDEHSQNVYKRAVEQGFKDDPVAYCDRMEQEFRGVWKALDISYDDFIRTTEPRHRAAVQKMAQACYDAGDIYEGVYEGWYCVSCEAFKPEKDLADGKCPLHPTLTPEWIREKNYFFRLSKYQDRLMRHFEAHPGFLEPDMRRNEILRLIEAGLEDISMSRAGQPWGIPLPFAPDSVAYVWFDALINYAAAVGYGTDERRFAEWWPADLHIIGKDITRFHTVVWPAMLWSAGVEAPRQVFGHGWIQYGGQRMSKSLGTSVDPAEAAARFGPDAIRLYLTKEISYGGDGDFTWERFEERYNVDLANNLGNLVSRVASMADKYRGGRLVPAGSGGRLAEVVTAASARYRAAMDAFAVHEGAAAAFQIVDATNAFIAETSPWALAKLPANDDRLNAVLFEAAEAVRVAAVLLLPVMPSSCVEILRRIGAPTQGAGVRVDADARWQPAGERTVITGPPLWPRSEPSTASPPSQETPRVDEKTTAAAPPAPAATPAPAAATPAETAADARITIDDFMKVELRVAKVREAAAVPKSKKLIQLSVDVGEAVPRTILAGIAEGYQPEQLVGKTIVIVANLKPAKLMGIESNGMVLAASQEGGPPVLVAADETMPAGTRVR